MWAPVQGQVCVTGTEGTSEHQDTDCPATMSAFTDASICTGKHGCFHLEGKPTAKGTINRQGHISPASGMPSGRSGYFRHSIIFTAAHSGVIWGLQFNTQVELTPLTPFGSGKGAQANTAAGTNG